MEYQNTDQQDRDSADQLREEADIHDEEYASEYPYPFLSDDYEIDVERVLRASDYCYKPGRFVDGYRRKRLFELVDLDSLEGKRVLDVGCGNGQFSVFFALYGAEVHGFDISPVGVDIATHTARVNAVDERTHFTVQSAADLSYEDGTFDIVVCNAALHHLFKYDGVEDELYRVIADDGRLVFADGIRDNPIYNLGRNIYRKLGGEGAKGDVDITNEDYRLFVDRYESAYVERHTLLFGIKKLCKYTMGQEGYPLPVRGGLYLAKRIDDVLFSFPQMEQYALDIVGSLEKSTDR